MPENEFFRTNDSKHVFFFDIAAPSRYSNDDYSNCYSNVPYYSDQIAFKIIFKPFLTFMEMILQNLSNV